MTVDFGDGTNTTLDPFKPQPNNATTVTIDHIYSAGRNDPYVVTVTVDDGLMQFHSIKQWNSVTVSVQVEKEKGGKTSDLVLWAALVVAIIVVALIVLLLFMRRRKGEEKPSKPKDMGGMEGMRPPGA